MARGIRNSVFEVYKEVLKNSKLVVGITGVDRGVGTTHTSLMIANYFTNWLGKRTCYIEYGVQNQIISLGDSLPKESGSYFEYKNISCYPRVMDSDMGSIMSRGYQCIIIDFGTACSKGRKELLRCDRKCLVTSLKPWKLDSIMKYMDTGMWGFEGKKDVLVPFGTKKERNQFYKLHKEDITIIPYEPDPFSVSESSLNTLNKLFY